MEKELFDWPVVLQYDVKAKCRLISRKFSGMKFFSPERSLNQPKATRVFIRSINQSNRSISVRLLFLFCSRVFISRSYENRSSRRKSGTLEMGTGRGKLGSISAVSRVRSLILPEERLFRGMSAGSFPRTAAGNRAYLKWERDVENVGNLIQVNMKGFFGTSCPSCSKAGWRYPAVKSLSKK